MSKAIGHWRLGRALSASVIVLALAGQSVTAAYAQDTLAEARLRKMEAEVRALQRAVFPGAEGKVFKPEITAGTTTAPVTGQPASTAVSDLLTRMDTLEAQIAKLTGQIETDSHRISQIEARLGPLAPAAAASDPAAPAATPTPAPAPAAQSNLNAMSGGASTKPATAPAAGRVAAVAAIEKPQTADAGDDEYSYGYRLWEAKYYPEAQQQLKLFADKYPKHAKISYGRNLLGRAFLDDGKPREAAQWFLQNFQTDKRGARAPDSLLYLGVAMKQLKDTNRACIALAEFADTYVAEASGRLKGTYDATRNGLKCS